MTNIVKDEVVRCLREAADKIDAGNSYLTQEQAMDIISSIAHELLSKEQACNEANKSRSEFDKLIKANKLPKGRRLRGFKELFFFKDEIIKAKLRLK